MKRKQLWNFFGQRVETTPWQDVHATQCQGQGFQLRMLCACINEITGTMATWENRVEMEVGPEGLTSGGSGGQKRIVACDLRTRKQEAETAEEELQ